MINQGWVTQIASQIEVNKPFSRSAYSPSNNDLLDSEEVQQLPSTRAQAHTYERNFRSSLKMHMRPYGGPTHGYMKCSTYKKFHVNSPWVFECTLQKYVEIIHT